MNKIPLTMSVFHQRITAQVLRHRQYMGCFQYFQSKNPVVVVLPVSSLHTSRQSLRKVKKDLSSEPTRFTSSPANVRSMPYVPDANQYQPIIISISFFIFIIYFLLLREENDIDEQLNYGLFDRVPQLEEPHLIQAIPRMKDAGVDTREAERRLQELQSQRLGRQSQSQSPQQKKE